jgi:hypothetical protein
MDGNVIEPKARPNTFIRDWEVTEEEAGIE